MPFVRVALLAVAQAAVVLAGAAGALRLWEADLRVPLYYGSDALWFASLTKGLVATGWLYELPQLSAPFSLQAVAFPALTHVDWVIMRGLALCSDDPGVVLNLFWLLSLVLAAWSCTAALALLGVAPWLGFAGGVLYALLPGAFIRNVIHIVLVYYAVPLLCLLAVHIVRGGFGDGRDRRIRALGALGIVVQGLNYVYFSALGVLLFAIAGLAGWLRRGDRGSLRTAAAAIALLLLTASANLLPALWTWSRDGQPPAMDYKSVAQAEHYGLTLRRLLAPHRDSPLASVGAWRALDPPIGFPIANESLAARLGPFAALGLLLALGAALALVRCRDGERERTLQALGVLSLATLLVGTVGGFGVIINVLTIPDIRAYNRLSVFLAFFAIAALGLWLSDRLRTAAAGWRRRALAGAAGALIALSLADQLLDAGPLLRRRAADAAAATHEQGVVAALERALPAGAAVFQMPVTDFPNERPQHRLQVYDHARPALWSRQLRWSWPSFSQRHRSWQDEVVARGGGERAAALVLSGFDAVWIDRVGLRDGGAALLQEFAAAGAPLLLDDPQRRYAVVDLRPLRATLSAGVGAAAFDAERKRLLAWPSVSWGRGFHPLEADWGGQPFVWSRAESEAVVRSTSDAAQRVTVAFRLHALQQGSVAVRLDDGQRLVLPAGPDAPPASITTDLAPGGVRRVWFTASVAATPSPDGRELAFAVIGPRLTPRAAPPAGPGTPG